MFTFNIRNKWYSYYATAVSLKVFLFVCCEPLFSRLWAKPLSQFCLFFCRSTIGKFSKISRPDVLSAAVTGNPIPFHYQYFGKHCHLEISNLPSVLKHDFRPFFGPSFILFSAFHKEGITLQILDHAKKHPNHAVALPLMTYLADDCHVFGSW